MTLQATGYRVLKIWRFAPPAPSWHWNALVIGRAQPKRFALGRGPWRYRPFRFHLTPIHVERWDNWEIGLCLGKWTICLVIHR